MPDLRPDSVLIPSAPAASPPGPVRSFSVGANDIQMATVFAGWEKHLYEGARTWADWFLAQVPYGPNRFTPDGGNADRWGAYFYDLGRIFKQIADYTGDTSWLLASDSAVLLYRDGYVLPNHGYVNGYYSHSVGLMEHYLRTKDPLSLDAVRLLAQGSFSADNVSPDWLTPVAVSREVAFALESHCCDMMLGYPRRMRSVELSDKCLGHIDQWLDPRPPQAPAIVASSFEAAGPDLRDERTWDMIAGRFPRGDLLPSAIPTAPVLSTTFAATADDGGPNPLPNLRPFMVGLTCESLIRWHGLTGDLRVLPAIRKVLDLVWSKCWLPDARAFKYTDIDTVGYDNSGGTEPAPDVSFLIGPAYAWVYAQTGEVAWRDRADAVAAGAVDGAWLVPIKQFAESYRWSFDYLTWRSAVPDQHPDASPLPPLVEVVEPLQVGVPGVIRVSLRDGPLAAPYAFTPMLNGEVIGETVTLTNEARSADIPYTPAPAAAVKRYFSLNDGTESGAEKIPIVVILPKARTVPAEIAIDASGNVTLRVKE